MAGESLAEAIEGIEHQGTLRLGAIRTEDASGERATTLSMGGELSLQTQPINGVRLVGTFFTTNPLFGKKDAGMFLDSQQEGYTIVGESYLEIAMGKSLFRAGRQRIDTPFADSDDIGMIPNTFEGYSAINQDIQNTTIVLGFLDKFAGVDAPTPEKFTELQPSKDPIFVMGLSYEAPEKTTLSAWHYRLDDTHINYAEVDYQADTFNMGLQYTDQDHHNRAYGINLEGRVEQLSLGVAYNRANGTISNGFGGGPFFTSSEDHTIAEVEDQEAYRYALQYVTNQLTLGIGHVDFDQGEDETDYIASFEVNEHHTLDVIYSQMYDDGNMVRFFANYTF